ncbi:MAG: hypothetical protein LBE92_21485 [Chryseobacterium sp.]|jgi:hypothetical protein|uniref:hypothetical protein n=1 Tax=Chryseobacterium sp. TaxID=1871047 RepID=UPI0028347EE1|nr:hypothetical protein [Chryseobacterium sp.]MDR2238695.1 hypothetical protein [Chryseobacterium sp.]
MKPNRFSPFTDSQYVVLNSYVSLIANISSRPSISVPSYRTPSNPYRTRENPLEDLPDAISSWTETIRELVRDFRSEKIETIKDLVREALDDGMGRDVTYNVTFSIDWGGDVKLDSIIPEGYPTIGEKSNYIGTYTEKLTVKVNDADTYVNINQLNTIKASINQKFNIDVKAEKERQNFEKQIKDFTDRAMRDHVDRLSRGEYRDPPTRDRMNDIGRMA